ncbi:MAG: 3-hydroxyacyl-[acyl-carrier-protein] dehydratase FabZ [Phycisphaerae bacterium]|nr:3-hydroxyacyl-[acyl-carrier-protein] dehydratase FabZ [Phycisphaerae bacterium]
MRFRMVDRIVAFEAGRSIRAVKTVSFEEYRLKAAFGDPPYLPESLVLETVFQAALWLVMISSEFTQMGLVVGVEEVRFVNPVGPGDRLSLEVEAGCYRVDSVRFDGRVQADGKIVADVRGCLADVVQLAEYCKPDDMKVLFSEIYNPDNGGVG